jgi:hypothetical protein
MICLDLTFWDRICVEIKLLNPDPHCIENYAAQKNQCLGSGCAWICIGFDRLDPDPDWVFGSGTRREKITKKH